MREQERQAQANIVLNLLQQRTAENSIKNIMTAIENGGTSNTAMNRLRELENRQTELERQFGQRAKTKRPKGLFVCHWRTAYHTPFSRQAAFAA